jgi:dTDP-glucose 4,6-dehydratase
MGADFADIEFIEDRLGHDLRYSIDRNKITTELDYEPKIDFSTGLDSTIRWYLENESWWLPLKN